MIAQDTRARARPHARHGPPSPAILCAVCGSDQWHRCASGTAPTAQAYPNSKVVDLRPADDVRMVAYCLKCDPLVVRK